MIDSHCHLADDAFAGDLEDVVQRARAAGLKSALCILSAGDEQEARAAARVRQVWPAVRFSVGIHPHNAAQFGSRVGEIAEVLPRAIGEWSAVAIGEIGLDYHYDFSPRPVQQAVFGAQTALALALDLPVIIHTREATDDTFAILREAGQRLRGVFHCFTGDPEMARAALDIGFYISLAGIVTFPRAEALRDVAKLVPADRLLIETDAPYLAPVPHRGKRNEPAFVGRVAETIAALRGVPAAELGAQLARNFEALLGPTVSHQTA
jgi:TatD DNase family protein